MTLLDLLRRNLWHHRRTYARVLLGAALTAAIVTGALGVGASVRYSLQRQALTRLGQTNLAFDAGERFVRTALGDAVGAELRIPVANVLHRAGTANTPDESGYAGRVEVYGVDAGFCAIAETSGASNDKRGGFQNINEGGEANESGEDAAVFSYFGEGQAAINAALAELLRLRVGDEFVLRLPDPLRLPGEAQPESQRHMLTLTLRVARVLPADSIGDFSLNIRATPQPAVFLPLPALQAALNVQGFCNRILLPQQAPDAPTPEVANRALAHHLLPEDAGLRLVDRPGAGTMLRSRAVLLPPQTEKILLQRLPRAGQIATYFAQSISHADRSTPYSFVTASQDAGLPQPAPGRIILTDWLADDLGIRQPGTTVVLRTQALAPDGVLRERERTLTVESIVPVDAGGGRELMPDFPGFSNAESCQDWDPDLPVDLGRIRPQDEAYWQRYQGTPKAYLNLADARALWGSRYGTLTQLRTQQSALSLRQVQPPLFAPHELGYAFRPVRAEALQAGRDGVDFGQLFLSLSFFLILAALLLTALLFAFAVDARAPEAASLRALGFSARRVRRLFFLEGGTVALTGAVVGALTGVWYCRAVIEFLNGGWSGAVGGTRLWAQVPADAVAWGAASSFMLALGAIYLALRHNTNLSLARQQRTGASPHHRAGVFLCGGVLALAGAGLVLALTDLRTTNPGAFFGAGALLLCGGLSLMYALLLRVHDKRVDTGCAALWRLALRQAARRPGRSLAAAGMLASGVFLVVAVGVNRKDPAAGADRPTAGTGGYALWVETTLPLPPELDNPQTRRKLGLDDPALHDAAFLPLRMLDGDDASCLNLNRVSQPPLIGIDPAILAARGAFTFQSAEATAAPSWALLQPSPPASALSSATTDNSTSKKHVAPAGQATAATDLPAVADQTVLTWGLGRSVGDILRYTDETGAAVPVRLRGGLANSIFQGNLLVPADRLRELFPTRSAVRGLLVDTPRPEAAAAVLRRALEAYGVRVETTAQRLASFSRVENTYLTIFLLLGGLGLILGSAGLGVLLLRNAEERRSEMALMRAVGFYGGRLTRLLLLEQALLLGGGLGTGLLASLAAGLPALLHAAGQIPYSELFGVLTLLLANAALWTYLSAQAALRAPLLQALREE